MSTLNADQVQFISSSPNPFTNPSRYDDPAADTKVVPPDVTMVIAPDVSYIIDTSLQANKPADVSPTAAPAA